MKRDDLIKLEIAEELVDKIMALHGKSVEKHKADFAAATTELDGLKTQLSEANSAIEGFKKLDIDGVKAAADEWKAKAEQAQADAVAQISKLKFDHALDGALTGAKAKNLTAVKALLKADDLKLSEDGTIIGLEDQLKKIQSENDFLFESENPPPKVVAGGKAKMYWAIR
jgi:predicted  nucleic acid-binding Zn-ribbon protein